MPDTTNPGLVNVADEAFGFGLDVDVTAVGVTTPGLPSANAVNGANFNGQKANNQDTILNNVVGQVYAPGLVQNFFR